MVADPTLPPVTCGCAAGVVAPPEITTLAGETLTIVGSLLESVTVTPPAGAAAPNDTAKGAEPFGGSAMLDGRLIEFWATTVTPVTAGVRLGFDELAWIIVDPALTPVAAKLTLVELG
jgi:hypothetical protein